MPRLIARSTLLLPLAAASITVPAPLIAQAPPHQATAAIAGAMPNDKNMTCEMIAAERMGINGTIADAAQKKEKAAKIRKGVFGFAKTFATAMIPGAALLSGGSPLGSLAAQGAGQSAANMIANAGDKAKVDAPPAGPDAQQQARLTRLDSIASYRQCAS